MYKETRTVMEALKVPETQRETADKIEDLLTDANLSCMEAVAVLEAVKWEIMKEADEPEIEYHLEHRPIE